MIERSYLFVPGDRPERFDKALAAGAHAVILDLEDAVQPERKTAAREAVRNWLACTRSSSVYVRINPAGTPWHGEDLELIGAAQLRGVMLPKAQSVHELADLAARLRPEQRLIPLVETVDGWFQALALARVPGVTRLAFGSVDFMSDSGIRGEGEEMNSVRTHLVLVSRRAGIQAPIDGVSVAIDDQSRLSADVQRSRQFGFGAKLCIHPRQVACVNDGFVPGAEEITWALRVMAAVAGGSVGAVMVDGKLVDKPIVLLAQAVLAEADSAGEG